MYYSDLMHKESAKKDYAFKFIQAVINMRSFIKAKNSRLYKFRYPITLKSHDKEIEFRGLIDHFHDEGRELDAFINSKISSLHSQMKRNPLHLNAYEHNLYKSFNGLNYDQDYECIFTRVCWKNDEDCKITCPEMHDTLNALDRLNENYNIVDYDKYKDLVDDCVKCFNKVRANVDYIAIPDQIYMIPVFSMFKELKHYAVEGM
jgi:hypothetical protein